MLRDKIKGILGKALVPAIADRLADELEKLFVTELTETCIMAINRLYGEEKKEQERQTCLPMR
ncbi:MAG: hypothetical protein ISS52_04560 [Dehalococcoidia bacterium]|nr:hypothetical protein [Dehalococcoidia bacterium]